jgi:hypothetical protein
VNGAARIVILALLVIVVREAEARTEDALIAIVTVAFSPMLIATFRLSAGAMRAVGQ